MAQISREQVERVAKLAKLSIDEDQMESLQTDMGNILGFADKLAELDVSNVEPTTHAILIQNVFREDVCKASMPRERILDQCADQDGACYIVPKVVD